MPTSSNTTPKTKDKRHQKSSIRRWQGLPLGDKTIVRECSHFGKTWVNRITGRSTGTGKGSRTKTAVEHSWFFLLFGSGGSDHLLLQLIQHLTEKLVGILKRRHKYSNLAFSSWNSCLIIAPTYKAQKTKTNKKSQGTYLHMFNTAVLTPFPPFSITPI